MYKPRDWCWVSSTSSCGGNRPEFLRITERTDTYLLTGRLDYVLDGNKTWPLSSSHLCLCMCWWGLNPLIKPLEWHVELYDRTLTPLVPEMCLFDISAWDGTNTCCLRWDHFLFSLLYKLPPSNPNQRYPFVFLLPMTTSVSKPTTNCTL